MFYRDGSDIISSVLATSALESIVPDEKTCRSPEDEVIWEAAKNSSFAI